MDIKQTEHIRDAYQKTFLVKPGEMTESGLKVVEDLAKYCKSMLGEEIPNDPIALARYQGRQDVYNRMLTCINYQYDDVLVELNRNNGRSKPVTAQ